MFEEQFFKRKKINTKKLLAYGFDKKEDGYHYVKDIMDGQFCLEIFITESGVVSTKVIDGISGEEYTLYKVSASVGAFVGEVRTACGEVLIDISEKCFEADVFRSAQTLEIIKYVQEKYGDALEFLWKKFDDNAIWRRKDNRKWYGILAVVSKRKLGLDLDENAEIIDLRLEPEQMANTIDHEKYFPGWHMNKKTWYTIILDGSVPTEEICHRIDESYLLAKKKG